LLYLGYSAQKAVGTTFVAIFLIAISAIFAHNKLTNVDWMAGILLGLGGIFGAQIGAHFIESISTVNLKKLFAVILMCLAGYVFLNNIVLAISLGKIPKKSAYL
jgi:uncharacterized protein